MSLVRSKLWWVLFGTAMLTIVALWMPRGQSTILPVARVEADVVRSPQWVGARMPQTARNWPELPAHLPSPDLASAEADPFRSEAPQAVAAAAPASTAVRSVPADAPPPMPYKVIGAMRNPSGERIIVLGRVDKSLIVAAGMTLDEGFVVESVDEQAVQLSHPGFSVRYSLPIPMNPHP